MSKRGMSFESDQDHGEEASNSRETKLPRRNPNLQQQEAPIPNQEEGKAPIANQEGEAPIPADPNPEEEEAPNPAQELLFEKTVTFTEATGTQLTVIAAHKATLMAFLTDAERDILAKKGGVKVHANGNGVEYALELLKRDSMIYFNGWGDVARANKVSTGDSVEGFGYRAAGEFRLNLNIMRKTRMSDDDQELLFEKKLSYSETRSRQRELSINIAHRERVMAFLTDAEREEADKIGIGLRVPTRIANGDGVEYTLQLKRNKEVVNVYFNGWQEVARANQLNTGDLVQGFGYRAAGMFRLNLDIIRN